MGALFLCRFMGIQSRSRAMPYRIAKDATETLSTALQFGSNSGFYVWGGELLGQEKKTGNLPMI